MHVLSLIHTLPFPSSACSTLLISRMSFCLALDNLLCRFHLTQFQFHQVALRLKQQSHVEHSTAALDRPIWNKLWSLNVPHKVKTFIWWACSNSLPTRDNLHRRKMQVEPRRGFCYQRSKTAEHVLWTCPFARNVWALCRGKIQKCSNAATDFFSLFRLMVDRLSSNELEKWATKSWALWTARNKFYLEKIQWHPKQILGEAFGYLLEYQRLCAS